jgi:hypothetical protein
LWLADQASKEGLPLCLAGRKRAGPMLGNTDRISVACGAWMRRHFRFWYAMEKVMEAKIGFFAFCALNVPRTGSFRAFLS